MTDRLSALDVSFLYMETPTTAMHVGGVAVFEPPADGLKAGDEPSSEEGPAHAGDEGEDLRDGTYHSHA